MSVYIVTVPIFRNPIDCVGCVHCDNHRFNRSDFSAGTERTEPTCKLRYRRRDSDEIDMGGQWTGHGDVAQLEVIEETEEPERDPETGVFLESLEECPDCGNRTDTRTEYGRVDPEEIGISSRYIVFALRCKECDREWRERKLKQYDESLAEFEV